MPISLKLIALGAGLVVTLSPALACAQSGGDSEHLLTPQDMVDSSYQRVSSYQLEAGDSTAGVALTGSRRREGRRHDCEQVACASWYRDYTGQAEGWLEIAPGLSLISRYTLSNERHGNAAGALLTLPTRGTSQELAFGLRGAESTITFSAFDRAGWSSSNLADFAQRNTNGESRARRGLAITYETEQPLGRLQARAGLALERGTTPGGQADNSVAVTLHGQF